MKPTRREVLRALAAAPLYAASACACAGDYPRAVIPDDTTRRVIDPILAPMRSRRAGGLSVIDAHAHFFNASDVPVRGFIAESIGHNADPKLQFLLKEAAALADKFAERAPSAAEEFEQLNKLPVDLARSADSRKMLDDWFDADRERAAEDVSAIVSGTDFEKRYRELVPAPSTRSGGGISAQEVKDAETEAGAAINPQARLSVSDVMRKAKAFLQFLRLMISRRASNIRTYAEAFSPEGEGVEMVLGALVDFDYWLDCPPMSAHADQVKLHQHLAAMHGSYFRPVVGYNPWTDIEQNGSGRQRVVDAWKTGVFVAAKIYPPMGFMPAANSTTAAPTGKRRPSLTQLDATLEGFFKVCAENGIPVIAHAARSNGRDAAHDDFSSPSAWDKLLRAAAIETPAPIISLGHFGGDNPQTRWTADFANLMKVYPKLHLFGDLGYWDHLLCEESSTCNAARTRLKDVLSLPVGAETVADRVMFASDWLMLSQVPGWKAYTTRVREGLESITETKNVAKIMGGNARRCFARLDS